MSGPGHVLKIDDIVSTKSLDVSVLAGGAGVDREVLWAHSCELSDPEKWLGPHELLMTVGLCVPADPQEQVAFVGRLDDAGLAGIMIANHDTMPRLALVTLAEADRRGFPILLAAMRTPYAVVARHVAAANTSSQLLQVLQLSKLYHLAADATGDARNLVDSLAKLLGIGILVEDDATGLSVVSADNLARTESDESTRRYPLRGSQRATLVLSEYKGEELDSLLLVHLIKILEVAVDHILTAAERRAEFAAHVLSSLLSGTEPAGLDTLLAPYSASPRFQVAAFANEHGPQVARSVAMQRLPVIVGPGRSNYLALIPTDAVPKIRALAGSTRIQFGVSSAFRSYSDVSAAADEATRVLNASRQTDRRWNEFVGTTLSVLTRSHMESEEIVRGVLGPLTASTPQAQKLRETLFAYLRHDRRWQETADELGIHRQTLAYRLNRIEQETDMSVSRSSDLSAFWIAYQAWETTHASSSARSASTAR